MVLMRICFPLTILHAAICLGSGNIIQRAGMRCCARYGIIIWETHRWEWLINQCKNNIRALLCDRPSYYVRARSLFKASLLSETRKIFLTKSLFGSTWRDAAPVRAHFFVCVFNYLPLLLSISPGWPAREILGWDDNITHIMWKRHFICSITSKFRLRQRFREMIDLLRYFLTHQRVNKKFFELGHLWYTPLDLDT